MVIHFTSLRHAAALIAAACLAFAASPTAAQIEFERAPINYHQASSSDPVARLQAALDQGETELTFDDRHGYLPSVLEKLDVPVSSQMLVFSKTSFQQRRISRHRPRAIYFNDEVYIGWVQGGDVAEASAVDPQLGAVFYTLSQQENEAPQFVRDQGQCIVCHASSRTQGVPGHLVRSVFADASGQPQFGSGTFTTDHRSPFAERWGGWYVSGTHGAMRHMGNVAAVSRSHRDNLNREAGANCTDLSALVDVSPYLAPTSDIVALMVLEHQTQMHNLITRANYETRAALNYDKIMNAALDRAADYQSETTQRRIASVGDKLLQYLLFADEFELTSPVAGVSNFAAEFTAQGPFDQQGRSLRQFDLTRRLFKHPCSYLIYSDAFQGLPQPVKSYVLKRLEDVLTGREQGEKFAHLSAADRQAIREILHDTQPNLFDESFKRGHRHPAR